MHQKLGAWLTGFVEAAFQLARARHPAEHRAWVDLSFQLSGLAAAAPDEIEPDNLPEYASRLRKW
jgi:hypothetical protein